MPFWSGFLAVQAALTGAKPPAPLTFVALPRCEAPDDASEVVVCARRADRYRLPPDSERDDAFPAPVPGEPGSAAAVLRPAARCGIFAGERRCGRKEADAYGYGDGRDPVTLLSRIAGAVVDPDGR